LKLLAAAAAVAIALLPLGPGEALAQDKVEESSSAAAAAPEAPAWQDELSRRTGVIAIPEAKASLNLTDDYYFLGAADSKKVLTEGWGNPPAAVNDVLGMIFPARFKPLDEGAWAAVVTYDASGYVSDKDAKTADYAKLLRQMRENEAASNAERSRLGYATLRVEGWAEPPTYDPATHTVVWAKDLLFSDADGRHTLNYDIRVLGRRGVLSLNVVAALTDLADVRAAAQRIGRIAVYNTGERYADHGMWDKKAAYGVAGLVAAGVGVAAVKKVGLLALLLAFAKKGFIVIAAGAAAAFAWLRRLFAGKGRGTAFPLVAS